MNDANASTVDDSTDADSTERVRAVFAEHGITEADLLCRRADDSRDRWWCPSPSCRRAFETASGLVTHHTIMHEQSVIEAICGTETWEVVAEQLYIEQGLALHAIASALPPHTGDRPIRNDLRRFGLVRTGQARSTASSDQSETETTTATDESDETAPSEMSLAKRLTEMSPDEFDERTTTGGH